MSEPEPSETVPILEPEEEDYDEEEEDEEDEEEELELVPEDEPKPNVKRVTKEIRLSQKDAPALPPCHDAKVMLRRCRVGYARRTAEEDAEADRLRKEAADSSEGSSKPQAKGPKVKKKKDKSKKDTKSDDELSDLPPECYEEEVVDAKKAGNIMVNQMTPEWFRQIRITPEQLKLLSFSESLLMVDEVGNVSGKMYTSVKPAKFGGVDCICVHTGSYGVPDPGMECGTTITAFVTFDLKPLQEFIHEWAVADGKLTERKTFIMREEDSLHKKKSTGEFSGEFSGESPGESPPADILRVQISFYKDGELAEKKGANLGQEEQDLLVTEGANIILLRLLMIEKRALGDMELKTITFTGTVVKNKYAALTNGWENVKGEEIRTWTIRRTVFFEFGERIWDALLNQSGRLILRCQPENVHALIPLWFEPVKEIKADGDTPGTPASYPPYIWACDAELYSKYLLKRDELAADHRSYLLDHPDLRALLSDFIQAALLRKPKHLIPFTVSYFESFLKFRPESAQQSKGSSSSNSAINMGEWGEWAGEDGMDSYRFYSTRPTRSLDGLEKVDSEELLDQLFDSETEDEEGYEDGTVSNSVQYDSYNY